MGWKEGRRVNIFVCNVPILFYVLRNVGEPQQFKFHQSFEYWKKKSKIEILKEREKIKCHHCQNILFFIL